MVERSAIDGGIEKGVAAGLKKAAPSIVDVCLKALWEQPWFPFIAGGQLRLIEAGMKPAEAWELSRKVLLEWVRDEKATFGDPQFDWGPQGGRELIEACEIEYWDALHAR
jgi:hypothetical protein